MSVKVIYCPGTHWRWMSIDTPLFSFHGIFFVHFVMKTLQCCTLWSSNVAICLSKTVFFLDPYFVITVAFMHKSITKFVIREGVSQCTPLLR